MQIKTELCDALVQSMDANDTLIDYFRVNDLCHSIRFNLEEVNTKLSGLFDIAQHSALSMNLSISSN